MAKRTTSKKVNHLAKANAIVIQLDAKSKRALETAAQLRHVSVSEYLRFVAVPQAKREIIAARSNTILLTPDEQLAFWKTLNKPVKLTARQKQLGRLAPRPG